MLLMFTGCKKDSTTNQDYTSEFTVQSEDQSMVSGEDDALSDDVNTLVETEPMLSGRGTSILCGATVMFDTTTTAPILRRATITYSGVNCDSTRSRTGVVTITIPKSQRWKNAGAALTINAQNLRITRLRDNKSITVNGTKVITNVSGGTLVLSSTVTHSITSSGMSITFDDGTMRSWQIAKRRVFTKAGGTLVISTTGTYNDGTNNDVAVWGTNRNNKPFSTRIITPIVVTKDCHTRWVMVSGQIIHTKLTKDITVTFGLDASGNALTTCPTSGVYFMKIQWVNSQNNAVTVIRPY